MSDQSMTVIAQIKIDIAKVDEAKRELKKLAAETQKEPGCICYEVHQSAEDGTVFLFYERWADKSAVDKHFKAPHFQVWEQKAKTIVVEPVQATFWDHIS